MTTPSNQNEVPENGPLEVMSGDALGSLTRAEIDIQIATAHKYPRSMDKFKSRAISMATMDIETAESCLYRRPVGKGPDGQQTFAEGLSVRMAEIVGACYGNLRVAAMIVDITPEGVKARGIAHDLESNFACSSEVLESTLKKDGKTPYDPRMRVVIAKAALAKARRDATFQVVPKAIARPIEAAVRKLLADETQQTFAERRDGVVKWINEKLKIDPKRVWTALSIQGPGDLQTEHLELLVGLKTAIRDGEATVDETFPDVVARKPLFTKPDGTDAVPPVTDGNPPVTPREAPAPGQAAKPPHIEENNEAKLMRLMGEEGITAAELKGVLKELGKGVPSTFEGPQDLTDAVLKFTLDEWVSLVARVKKGRK